MHNRIHEILKQYWGYDEFRSLQEEIILSVLEGKDTLALMPTGGGKSITYQVPALVLEGICLVVTPLIALMKDQVEELQKRGIVAEAIYTGMGKEQIESTLNKAIAGKIKFLYVSPERLASEQFRARLKCICPCWQSTKPIVFRNGAMISGLHICGSLKSGRISGRFRYWH